MWLVGAVWARKTICMMCSLPVKLKPGRVGGAGFLTSALSPTDAPVDTWCPPHPGVGGRPGPGAPAQVEPESTPRAEAPGSLVSPWDEHTAPSPDAPLNLAQCIYLVRQGKAEKWGKSF